MKLAWNILHKIRDEFLKFWHSLAFLRACNAAIKALFYFDEATPTHRTTSSTCTRWRQKRLKLIVTGTPRWLHSLFQVYFSSYTSLLLVTQLLQSFSVHVLSQLHGTLPASPGRWPPFPLVWVLVDSRYNNFAVAFGCRYIYVEMSGFGGPNFFLKFTTRFNGILWAWSSLRLIEFQVYAYFRYSIWFCLRWEFTDRSVYIMACCSFKQRGQHCFH